MSVQIFGYALIFLSVIILGAITTPLAGGLVVGIVIGFDLTSPARQRRQ